MGPMKTPRNALCPCGSGKKFKRCHGLPENQRDPTKIALVAIAAVVLTGGAAFAYSLVTTDLTKNRKVWSAEHGHWHDAAGNELPAEPVPAPPGDPPPGKVWSAEHGHWHDEGGAELPAEPAPAPPGDPPPGKVWSAEHGHWHDAE